ncbi:MAG: hypothetical protein LBM02_10200 [Lachnospiraceae bacterium]|jgi:tRNA nucleotidyltransferase/poly(A) polymerase|nr:hypothetical protein [Lachnospiraceae bacterium]
MEKEFKLYKVGGCVRDALLGLKSKDIDYTFEFKEDFIQQYLHNKPDWFYTRMNDILKQEGFEIFLETPEAFTTRAKFPVAHQFEGLVADFVMARKESYPNKHSRMPVVEIGTLYDDLKRRDFTVNSIALDEENDEIIDPFNGVSDINNGVLRCPIDAETSFNDDPLRVLRLLRFSLTKNFKISSDCVKAMYNPKMWIKFNEVVSRERVREELQKMFKFDTMGAIKLLHLIETDILENVVFKDDLWLKPTFEKR